MSKRWEVVTTRERGEIWVFDASNTPPLIWGVRRDPDEPLHVGPGTQVYALPKDMLGLYLDTIIRPALDGTPWKLDEMLEILERYLQKPEEVAPLLGLLTGRVHLASQTHKLTARLSDLFIHYIRQLPLANEPHEKMVLAVWCYQLTNAFLVAIRDVGASMSWVHSHSGMLNETFVEGAKELIAVSPAFLAPQQAAGFKSQLEVILVTIEDLRGL